MFSLFLVCVSMLVTLSWGQSQSCKSFLLGSLPIPLDWCFNYGSTGLTYSYDYSSSDGTTVMLNYYAKAGCSGTTSSSTSSFTSMIKMDGSVCDNVALVKTYSSSSCAVGDIYSSLPYVTDWCYEYTTGVGYKYSCASGNVTLSLWSASATCANTASSMTTMYMNMECTSASYTEVTCDAAAAGGSDSNILSISYIIYGLLFAVSIVKLL